MKITQRFGSLALGLAWFASPVVGQLTIQEVVTGRLVDVHASGAGTGVARALPVMRGVLVGEPLPDADAGYRIETDAVTGRQRLVVLGGHVPGSATFERVVRAAMGSARALNFDGRELSVMGPDLIARNAAIAVRFNAPLDTSVQPSDAVEFKMAGLEHAGAEWAFEASEAIDESGRVESRGLILDLAAAPLPEAHSRYTANLSLRVFAGADARGGRFGFARTQGGEALAQDVTLALRSGTSDDAHLGLLPDEDAPRIVGEQAIRVSSAQDLEHPVLGTGVFFRVKGRFRQALCAQAPEIGDVLELTPGQFRVVRVLAGPAGSAGFTVVVQNLQPDAIPAGELLGTGQYLAPFDLGDAPECFVSFTPLPDTAVPGEKVDPLAQVHLRFNEIMDVASVQAFDSFMIAQERTNPSDGEIVAASISVELEGRRFSSRPLAAMEHQQGIAEPYYVLVDDGTVALSDLAGNGLAADLPVVAFTLDPFAASQDSNSVVLTFNGIDGDGDGLPDFRGQYLGSFAKGTISGRPVVRFSGSTERSNPVPSLMHPFLGGVQTPFSPLGSKLMNLWRHVDFTYSVDNEILHNLDVEGLSWAAAGAVSPDAYAEFEIALGHSYRFPDEYLEPTSNLPQFEGSGLRKGPFEPNILGGSVADLTVVHSREKGYAIDPSDAFVGSGGSVMQPFPWNTDADPSDDTSYTWRDTAITAVGAPEGVGVEPKILAVAGLISLGDEGREYPEDQVPTIGLPLLMQFSCFPDDTAQGLNHLDVSLAVNSSGQPNFRLFSTGGYDISGLPVIKDPDLESKGTGGFDPESGLKTKGFDNVFYHGTADFVMKVSRIHTIWFDTGAPSDFGLNTLEPLNLEGALSGPSVEVAYRGALAIPDGLGNPSDAHDYGPYGEPTSLELFGQAAELAFGPVQYLNDDPSWKSSVDELDGARYIQMRISFVADTQTNETPDLSAVAFSYQPL